MWLGGTSNKQLILFGRKNHNCLIAIAVDVLWSFGQRAADSSSRGAFGVAVLRLVAGSEVLDLGAFDMNYMIRKRI